MRGASSLCTTSKHARGLYRRLEHELRAAWDGLLRRCIPPVYIQALRELFAAVLLPDRRLRSLAQQPLAALPPGREGSRHLLYWYLEDCIKKRYGRGGLARAMRHASIHSHLLFLLESALALRAHRHHRRMANLLTRRSYAYTCCFWPHVTA